MITLETTDHFVNLSKQLEDELTNAHSFNEESLPPGSSHESVKQTAAASGYLDLAEWESKSDVDKESSKDLLLRQLRENVKSSLEGLREKWPEIEFYKLSVNWLNIQDDEFNPNGSIGRFFSLIQGVNK